MEYKNPRKTQFTNQSAETQEASKESEYAPKYYDDSSQTSEKSLEENTSSYLQALSNLTPEKTQEFLSSNPQITSDLLKHLQNIRHSPNNSLAQDVLLKPCSPNCAAYDQLQVLQQTIESLNYKLDSSRELIREKEEEHQWLKEVVERLEETVTGLVENEHHRKSCCAETCLIL